MIVFKTNKGEIKVELDFDNTPKTAQNFMQYVEDGFFDGTIFHRVIDGFMIQGGGFTEDMAQKDSGEHIQNEGKTAKPNKRGTLAMARTMDPHSATAQFFINVKDNDFLNFTAEDMQGWGYCVFGEVVEGLDVIDAIKGVATGRRAGHDDVPVDSIIIESVTVLEPAEA